VELQLRLSLSAYFDFHAYRSEFLKDDVRVNFQVPHPNQLGTSELASNFLILNKAPSSILVEETVAIEIASTDFSNNPQEMLRFASCFRPT